MKESGPPNKRVLKLTAQALLAVLFLVHSVSASTFAVIDPESSEVSAKVAAALETALSDKIDLLDRGLSDAAFRSFRLETPFNLDTATARSLGSAIGCRFYILVRADVQRRSRFGREEYYEAHAAYFLVNSVTGLLEDWQFSVYEEAAPREAEERLLGSVEATAIRLLSSSDSAAKKLEPRGADPREGSNDESIKPPMPYDRVKPEYTPTADLYGIEATVDAEVRIDADGTVLEVKIVRWAGYGLDESVISAIRTMKWRPAERNGGFLPMSVLLRYNFRDIEDEP